MIITVHRHSELDDYYCIASYTAGPEYPTRVAISTSLWMTKDQLEDLYLEIHKVLKNGTP